MQTSDAENIIISPQVQKKIHRIPQCPVLSLYQPKTADATNACKLTPIPKLQCKGASSSVSDASVYNQHVYVDK